MKFKIVSLKDIPFHEQRAMLTRQIAKCYQSEWGKYRADLTDKDWVDDTFRSAEKDQKFVALTDEDKLVGTITLKQENMENKYPTLGPWLSGLVVPDEFRSKKISAILMVKLLTVAQAQGSNTVYLFSHVLNLEGYYKKFGWEIYKVAGDENPTYQNKPILLFKGHVPSILTFLQNYINANHIVYDEKQNEVTLPEVPSAAATIPKEISPRIEP